jgi:EamA-like transporter family protein
MARDILSAKRIAPGHDLIGSASEPHARTRLWQANASLALAGCLWGTGFLFGKIAFREMTVFENVGFRFVFACIVLVPIAIQRRSFLRERFPRRDVWLMLAASVIGFPVQFMVQFKGLELTTVSHASLIVGTLPVLDGDARLRPTSLRFWPHESWVLKLLRVDFEPVLH